MLIRLFRNFPHGLAITGCLYMDSLITTEGVHQYQFSMNTLEHLDYAIPDGFYRLRLTYSPRFQEILPILDNVIGYQKPISIPSLKGGESSSRKESFPSGRDLGEARRCGIRIHAGNTIEHTTGCILVGDLPCLVNDSLQFRERSQASYSLEGSDICLRNSRKRLEELRTYLLNYIKRNPHEEIYIQLASPDPYPDVDIACSYEQQQHIYESLRRAQRLREERELIEEAVRL